MPGLRAIVIGGGIGGITAAIALRRAGIDVTVYERAPAPGEVGAGIGLWGGALRALAHIGVQGPVLRAGEQSKVADIRDRHGRVLSHTDFDALGPGGMMAVVHRAELLGALLSSLPDGVVQFGRQLIGVSQDRDGVTARLQVEGGQEVEDRADALIGADGINSVVRSALLGHEPARYAGYTCWRGVAEVPQSAVGRGYLSETWGHGARFGIARIGKERVYWWAAANAPPGGVDSDARAALVPLYEGWHAPIPEIIAATTPERILRNDILDRPPRRGWSKGRITLLGDAAHATTPNLAHGGCMAIEDGVVLAHRLAGVDRAGIVAALLAYEHERYPRTASIVRASRRLGMVGQWESPILCRARDWSVRLTPRAMKAKALLRFNSFDVGPASVVG